MDVAVIGGGVIGLSIAWRAAERGLEVALFDDAPGRASSAAAAGLLAPVTEVHYGEQALLELALASARGYPDFVAQVEQVSGKDVGYRSSGTLMVARDADDAGEIERLRRYQETLGLDVQRLTSRECRKLEPALSPRVRGGIFVSGDHSIDNRALTEALVAACKRAGVRFVHAHAARIDLRSESVSGVRTAAGDRVACSKVVLAAGCWSGSLEGLPAEALPPVRPVKGQLLYLHGPRLIERNIRGLEVYVVPRSDGRIAVGATVEEMGFDLKVTAGAAYDLLRAAHELLPAVSELELAETVVGLRPGSPDNAPMLGESSIEGLIIATGHYRNGILLTPITAESIVELLATGRVPPLIGAFSPSRFQRSKEPVG